MLNEDEIWQTLHASRVATLPAVNPHGPLGLEQLAEIVTRLLRTEAAPAERVQRPIALPVETWEKLDRLARAATPADAAPLTASALAAALLRVRAKDNLRRAGHPPDAFAALVYIGRKITWSLISSAR